MLSFKDLELHIESRMLKKANRWIELTKKEYELLFILMKNTGRVLTREMLVSQVWDYEVGIETNVVDVYIRHLRNKLDTANKEEYIQTVRGIGYMIRDEQN
ncbi:Response regulator ArlR [compost metagenome]